MLVSRHGAKIDRNVDRKILPSPPVVRRSSQQNLKHLPKKEKDEKELQSVRELNEINAKTELVSSRQSGSCNLTPSKWLA